MPYSRHHRHMSGCMCVCITQCIAKCSAVGHSSVDVCCIALLRTDTCILTPQMTSSTGSGRRTCGNTPGGHPRTVLSCIGIAAYAFRSVHQHQLSIPAHPYIVPLPLGNIHDRLACHVHPHTPVTRYSRLSVARGSLEDVTGQATVGRWSSGF